MIDQIGTELRARFDGVLTGVLGRPAGLAAAEIKKAEECMFLAAAPDRSATAPARSGSVKRGLGTRTADKSREREQERLAGQHGQSSGYGSGPGGGAGGAPGQAGRERDGEGHVPARAGVASTKGKRVEGAVPPAEPTLSNAPPAPKAPPPPAKLQQPAEEPAGKPAAQNGQWSKAPVGSETGGRATPPPIAVAPEDSPADLLTEKEAEKKSERRKERSDEEADAGKVLKDGLRRGAARSTEAMLSEALKLRFEAESVMSNADSRAQYVDALAKLINSKSLAENQVGLDQLIEKAKAGMEAARR
jgi:hypothetical protein